MTPRDWLIVAAIFLYLGGTLAFTNGLSSSRHKEIKEMREQLKKLQEQCK